MKTAAAKNSAAVGMLLIAACFAASAGVQRSLDQHKSAYEDAQDVLWIPSGRILKRVSLGHEGLLADIYWTRAIQYYGGRIRDHKTDFRILGSLLDITTDLDPQLLIAYKFGAIFLAEQPPRGAGRPDDAVRLVRKGIQANPDQWRLWHDLGFIYYWNVHDYGAAANAFLEGSKNPQAAPWMKVLAATIGEEGGNRETSRFLWSEIYRSTEDPSIRQNAEEHLRTLKATEDIEELGKLAHAFHEQTGSWPRSFAELVAQRMLGGVPADPLGFEYQILPEGKIGLHPKSKIKLEDDGKRPQ